MLAAEVAVRACEGDAIIGTGGNFIIGIGERDAVCLFDGGDLRGEDRNAVGIGETSNIEGIEGLRRCL